MPKETGYRSQAAKRLRKGRPSGPSGAPVDPSKSDSENDANVRAKRLEEYESLPKKRSVLDDESQDDQLLKAYRNKMTRSE